VPYVEAIFLPEFKIKGDVTGKDFQVLLFLYLFFLIFILFGEDFVGRQGPKCTVVPGNDNRNNKNNNNIYLEGS
jgi:hypothetical protein